MFRHHMKKRIHFRFDRYIGGVTDTPSQFFHLLKLCGGEIRANQEVAAFCKS
jgi:hypothetical protein